MKKNWMAIALTAALCLSAVSVGSVPAAAQAVPTFYPETYDEYTTLLEQYPDFYRIDHDMGGNSVYFLNRDIHSIEMSLIVSSNNELHVIHNTYGAIFRPDEDGIYVVTVLANHEEIVSDLDDPLGHYHRFYPEIDDYTVTVEGGEISVEYEGNRNWEAEAGHALMSSDYFSFVNGILPDGDNHYDSYITTVYRPYSVESYFCVNVFYSEIIPYMPRVLSSDESIAKLDKALYTSSAPACDDIQDFFSVKALQDGDVTVTADGHYQYDLTIKDGVFHHVRKSGEATLPGDLNGDGSFGVRDVILLQRWVLAVPDTNIVDWQAADFNKDGELDVFDLCLMKRELIGTTVENPPSMDDPINITIQDYDKYEAFLDENELRGKIVVYDDLKSIGEFTHFTVNSNWQHNDHTSLWYGFDDGSGKPVFLLIRDREDIKETDVEFVKLTSEDVTSADMRNAKTDAENSVYEHNGITYEYVNGQLLSVTWYDSEWKYRLTGNSLLSDYPAIEGTFTAGLLDCRTAVETLAYVFDIFI